MIMITVDDVQNYRKAKNLLCMTGANSRTAV